MTEGPHCPVCGQKAYVLPLLHLFTEYRQYVYQCATCMIVEHNGNRRVLRWTINVHGESVELKTGVRLTGACRIPL